MSQWFTWARDLSPRWFDASSVGKDGAMTQEGQPSGVRPLRARSRLTSQWVLVPLVIAVVFVVGFGLKFLL